MAIPLVFMTGSASGVGLHLTERFLRAGYRVVATDINIAQLKAVAKDRLWDMDRVWLRKLDVTQKSAWQKLWHDIQEKWGDVDILCNVAGYLKPGHIHETDIDEIDKHFNINVKGLVLGSKIAAEHMVPQHKGHIINIASLAGIAPIPGIALYSASKYAVRGFSLALAQELKPFDVAVTVICPDAIETPMLALQEDYEEAALTFSGSRVLRVEDLGDLVLDKVIFNRPVEVLLPLGRGLLAKLSNVFPALAFALSNYLQRLGRAQQDERKRKRKS